MNYRVQLSNNYSTEELFQFEVTALKILKQAQNQIFPYITMIWTLEEFLSRRTDSGKANQTFTESADCSCDCRDNKTHLRNESIKYDLEFLFQEVLNVYNEGLRAKEKSKYLCFSKSSTKDDIIAVYTSRVCENNIVISFYDFLYQRRTEIGKEKVISIRISVPTNTFCGVMI